MKILKVEKLEPDWRKEVLFLLLINHFKKNVSSNLCGFEVF